MKKHPITRHHILSQSNGGNALPDNIILLRSNVHSAVHLIFEDHTPIQQIRTTLNVAGRTMNAEAYKQIDEVIRRFEGIMEYQTYKPELFNLDKFLAKNGT